MSPIEQYREAAKRLWGANDAEVRAYFKEPHEDTGEWAPHSLGVIYLEPDGRFKEDTFVIPNKLSYYGPSGFDSCLALSEAAGIGYIEYINTAVAAIYSA